MQPEERNPTYLWDMLEAAREVKAMLENYDLAAFMADRVMMRALAKRLRIRYRILQRRPQSS